MIKRIFTYSFDATTNVKSINDIEEELRLKSNACEINNRKSDLDIENGFNYKVRFTNSQMALKMMMKFFGKSNFLIF